MQVDTVCIKKELTFEKISAVLDIPLDEIQYLNPSYRKKVIPYSADGRSILTLPANKMGAFITNEAAIYNFNKNDSLENQKTIMQEVAVKHTVAKGEHLSNIARKYSCTVSDIKIWNGITSNTVKPGKKLTIYVLQKKAVVKTDKPETTIPVENAINVSGTYKYYPTRRSRRCPRFPEPRAMGPSRAADGAGE